MFMTTLITEPRPRFTAFIDVDEDLIIQDHANEVEIGFAFYTIADAPRIAGHISTQPTGYFQMFPFGTFYPHEDTRYTTDISPEQVVLPARYTAAPVLVDGTPGFALRDHFGGLEAYFRNTSLSDVAALLETNQAALHERLEHAKAQFVGEASFLGVPISTFIVTGPEFLVTPSNEETKN